MARKLILGLRVNRDKANSRRYVVTRQMVYLICLSSVWLANISNPHISVQYILCKVKFKFKYIQLN